PLKQGVNFVSAMKPQGALGVLEYALKDDTALNIYGNIRTPLATDITPALKPRERIWNCPVAPGIHLQAPLNLDFNLGKMRFSDAMLRIYSPPSTHWLQKNTDFQATHGYDGKLEIPSAGIEIDISADLQWGMPEALFYAQCKGVTLGKLEHLLDIAGTDKLLSHLPKDLQKAVAVLDTLELTSVFMDVGLANEIPVLNGVAFTISMPDLNWKIWKNKLVMENISCRFEIDDPFGVYKPAASSKSYTPSITVIASGTVEIEGMPVNVTASSADDFTLYASLGKKQSIPLKKLMQSYTPGVPAPSDLTVDSMVATIAPSEFYAMSMALADKPKPWSLPVGHPNLSISDVHLNFQYPAGGSVSGSFGGTLNFSEDANMIMRYDIPGNFVIRGNFPPVKLSHLIDTLCNQHTTLPKGFDLEFGVSSFLIQEHNDNMTFQFATELEGLGSFAFEALQSGPNQWGFAAGLDLSAGNPSNVAGLSAIGRFEKAFKLEKFLLVASSLENPAFNFPDLAQFNNPSISAKQLSLPGKGGLIPGLNLFAEWTLDTKDKKQKLLKKLLGLDPTLDITLQVGENPEKDAKLFVKFGSKLNGHPFDVEFGAMVQSGELGLFLTGTITVKIQKQLQTFDVTMLFVEDGALISADMTGTTAIHFGPLQLSDLGIEIGVDWEGVPSLGISASLDIGNFDSSFAIFFDSTDPAKSLLAGAVSDLTLGDVVDTMIGKAAPSAIDHVLDKIGIKGTQQFQIPGSLANDLDHLKFDQVSAAFKKNGGIQIPASSAKVHLIIDTKGSVWYLTDLTTLRHYELRKKGKQIQVSIEAQFYCAPQSTSIGTKTFPQGFYINGAIEFLNFEAQATIDISANKGVAIDAQMDKIIIGKESLFCLKAEKGKGGPKVSAATFNRPRFPVKELRPAHFYINGCLEMLGISEGIYISLSEHGFEFELETELPAVELDISGTFAGSHHLEVEGDIKVGLGTINLGSLGKIHLNTDAEGSLDIRVYGNTITATVKASFEALGKTHNIGTCKLDINTAALTKLPETLSKEAEQILGKYFQTVLKEVKTAEQKVKQLDNKIDSLRKSIKRGQDANDKKYQAAVKKLKSAQDKLKGIDKQIDKANDQIGKYKKEIKDKKKWAGKGDIIQKAARGVKYTAYAAEKNAAIAGLETEIGSLKTAKATAKAALEVAKQPIKGLKAAAKAIPVDSDPRIVALFTAKKTALAALETAKLPLKALAG
ncbi:MAG: hypothetical protein MJA83_19785, partial [Gammaproteobacteria bacterium]|nr:hypothetical protein [Gammaproteobacteria bacterium]